MSILSLLQCLMLSNRQNNPIHGGWKGMDGANDANCVQREVNADATFVFVIYTVSGFDETEKSSIFFMRSLLADDVFFSRAFRVCTNFASIRS